MYDRAEGTVSEVMQCVPRDRTNFTSMKDICICASELSNGQSPGLDGLPNEFYKVSPGFIYA